MPGEDLKLPLKKERAVKRSCTKHGPYRGPYCPACYEKAIGNDATREESLEIKYAA